MLAPRPQRFGLTRENKYESLHGNRKPTPPLLALPRDDSSDEESDEQHTPDVLSDDPEFGATEPKKEINIPAVLNRSTDLNPAKGDDSRKRGLSVEPSNIPAAGFTSGTDRNGSQSNQKRKGPDLDDDETLFYFAPRKQSRQSYGYGSTNINGVSIKKTEPDTKKAPISSAKAGRRYRDVNTDAMMAQVDKLGAKSEKSRRPTFREIPTTQNSERDRRASQRLVKSRQEPVESSSKIFKQPPRPSPKKVPKFRASLLVCEHIDPSRATRPSAPAKQPSVPTEDHALISSNFHNALKTATDKLGISNSQINLPPSATYDSSAPPTSLDAATTVSSPLSSLDDSIFGSGQEGIPVITSEDIPIYSSRSRPAVCPMCKQPVEKSFLEGFSKADTRMSLRQQAQFCIAHKERSAESEWAERGYPEIDWQQLDIRIMKYHTLMDEMLSTRNASFYRNAFEDFLKSGKNRKVQESLMGGDMTEGTSPGYYGGRGAKVMADNIMSRFASKLRRLAASDKLISSGGVSGYVQAVLVPELAIFLIRDDMEVDEETAREILRDSVEIGNLLNEEEDEIIADPATIETEVVDIT